MEDKQADSEAPQEIESGHDRQLQDDIFSSQLPPLDITISSEIEQKNTTFPVPGESSLENTSDIQQLMEEMKRLREDFETKVRYDESKERLIDTLHKELQTYREGFHFKILRPIFMDLISMHDDLDRILEDIAVKENSNSPTMLRNLQSFQSSIEEILRRYEVQTFSVEEDLHVSGKQRILKVVDVDDAAQEKHIAHRVRKGFVYEERIILRPELVEIYRFNANLQIKEAEA